MLWGRKKTENYHYHDLKRHSNRRKKEEKQTEYRETTRDELKEGKLHNTTKEKMYTINNNLPFCCSTQLS